MAERGYFDHALTRWAARHYLQAWRGGIDALVLGCTHYPLLAAAIQDALPDVRLIDVSHSTAVATALAMERHGIYNEAGATGAYEYYVSGACGAFDVIASAVVGGSVGARPWAPPLRDCFAIAMPASF